MYRSSLFANILLWCIVIALRIQACDGIGTDDSQLARVFGRLDKHEALQIRELYNKRYDVDLIQQLKNEVGGSFCQALVGWVTNLDPTDNLEYQMDQHTEFSPETSSLLRTMISNMKVRMENHLFLEESIMLCYHTILQYNTTIQYYNTIQYNTILI